MVLRADHRRSTGRRPDGGGYEIRTREGLLPTRFPSERPRPLGESSARDGTGRAAGSANAVRTAILASRSPARRYLAEPPQGGDAARVGELFRVRGGPRLLGCPQRYGLLPCGSVALVGRVRFLSCCGGGGDPGLYLFHEPGSPDSRGEEGCLSPGYVVTLGTAEGLERVASACAGEVQRQHWWGGPRATS